MMDRATFVNRFLAWPVPESVCVDLCATTPKTGRTGTNFFTADEAGQLFDHLFPDPRDPDPSREGIFRDHNCARCKNGTDLSRCPTPDRPGNCGFPHARND